MKRKEIEDKVERLDALTWDDPERTHAEADSILLEAVPPEVAEAYRRVREGCGFWFA